MHLPVIQNLDYISPSTFLTWKKCQYKVYLTKLSGLEIPPLPDSPAALVGSYFDCHVKHNLAKDLGRMKPRLELNKLIKGVYLPTNCIYKVDELQSIAYNLYMVYRQAKAYETLLSMKILDFDAELCREIEGINLLGIIDLVIEHKGRPVALDFKCNGILTSASPKQGYIKKIDKMGALLDGPHEKFGCTMEEIDSDWATQLSFYNWLLNEKQPVSCMGFIDQVSKTSGDKIQISFYRAIISDEFQTKLFDEVKIMRQKINETSFEEPSPTVYKCEAYKQVCIAANHCVAYKETLGNSDMRKMFA